MSSLFVSKVAEQTREPSEAHLAHINVQDAVCSSLAGLQGLLYGALNCLFCLLHNCMGKRSLHMAMPSLPSEISAPGHASAHVGPLPCRWASVLEFIIIRNGMYLG